MALHQGTRVTSQAIAETALIRQVDDKIADIEPDKAALITLINKLKKRHSVKSARYEWFERDYIPRWAQNSASAVANNAASTTVTVTDGTLFVPGDMFVVPKVVSSSAAPELVRVTVVAGNVLTVVRDVGTAGIDTIAANGALRLVGNAYEENGALPTAKTSARVPKITYTQIFRTTTDFSRTAMASETYGAPQGDRRLEHKYKLVEHKEKLNSALLWGRRSEALTGGASSNPIRTTEGLRAIISTNIVDAGGVFTQKKLDEFARLAFRYGPSKKILLAAPKILGAINAWASAHLVVKPAEDHFGVMIRQVETAYGIWGLVLDWMLEDGVASQNGFGGLAFSIDLDQISYLWLDNNGINRDTHVELDVVKDGKDGARDQILTEGGFQIKLEKNHAMLYNVTDYMQ